MALTQYLVLPETLLFQAKGHFIIDMPQICICLSRCFKNTLHISGLICVQLWGSYEVGAIRRVFSFFVTEKQKLIWCNTGWWILFWLHLPSCMPTSPASAQASCVSAQTIRPPAPWLGLPSVNAYCFYPLKEAWGCALFLSIWKRRGT